MPIPLVQKAVLDGLETVPNSAVLLKLVPVVLVVYLIRRWFQGASNTSERTMHGKVVMITGGTSGIGAEIARDLATRGAQLVLLTQHALDDFFLVEYIEELRERSNNELITAAQVDLTSLHSIRQFATKWVDNAPPRRLDMIILCANTLTPKGGKIQKTDDDVEINWGLNYLANFHL
ncbi:oxidoreductase-like protein, partial [Aureobasidium melanogenum]